MRTIQFYTTDENKSPVQEFLDTLPALMAQKTLWTFKLVKELPMIPEQYFKKLDGTDDLWEIRVDLGNNAVRFLGFWDAGNLIILTDGFVKKTQKTPRTEIAIATERKHNYLLRHNNG